ncbi:MAG: hypothetical protein IJX99_08650 [Clostridia bacterium]|nr:hypothetical protein [Clostridia bacterium]
MVGNTNAIEQINRPYNQLINYKMLYDYGDECIDVTGGWGITATVQSSNSYKRVDPIKNDNNIELKISSGTYQIAIANTLGPVSLSGYTKILAKFSILSRIQWGDICFINTLTDTSPSTLGKIPLSNGDNSSYGLVGDYLETVDISSTDNVYLKAHIQVGWASDGTPDIKLYSYALVKEDNWKELCTIAKLNPNDYIDEAELCANSTAIQTLLSNKEAVEFMIYNCTGDFMISAIQSSTFLTALNNSKYKTKIYANEHWAKFLTMIV